MHYNAKQDSDAENIGALFYEMHSKQWALSSRSIQQKIQSLLSHRQDDYYITFNEGHTPRSCMECASILVTGIKDLHVFGCWQKGSCYYVPKCVYQPTNSSQTASGNSLPLLYASSGETLMQRASWKITNLELGECLFNIHCSTSLWWYRSLKFPKLHLISLI